MYIGQHIAVNIRRESRVGIERTSCEVIQTYPTFCVLSYKGKYNFCAFYGDLKRREAITV